MNIPSYPKIFTIGQRYTSDLFNHPVEITEKLDGSQIGFGRFNGETIVRSKGRIIYEPDKLFQRGWDYIQSRNLPEGIIFYGEYLNTPKHNTLKYDVVPRNNIALFGAMMYPSQKAYDRAFIEYYADALGLDVVPLLFHGEWRKPIHDLLEFLDDDSYLGGTKIEGIVVKNYQEIMIGGQVLPITSGKFVSEKFKELNHKTFGKEKTTKGNWITYLEGFRTEARWRKAIEHMRDKGELTDSPKDIGPLIKEIVKDITEEHQEEIKDLLWKYFGKDLLRRSTSGFPEFYKEYLLEQLDKEV